MPREATSLVEHFGSMKASYNMTQPSRLRRERQVPRQGVSSDYHLRQSELFYAMELARDLEMNEPILSQGIRRLTSNLKIGKMFPDPNTGDKDIDALLLEKWSAWSTDPDKCHAARELSFDQMCVVAFRRIVVDGDCFGIPIKDANDERYQSIQTLEAHRCREANRAKNESTGLCGVKRGENGVRKAYYFTKEPVGTGTTVKVGELKPIDAYDENDEPNVFHVYNPERFGQRRGFTHVAPVFDQVAMRDDIDFATLIKHQTASCIGAIEEVDPALWAFFQQQGIDDRDLKQYYFNGQTSDTLTMRPGGIYRPKPGHKLTAFSPNVPNPSYFEHVKLLLTYLGLSLDLPLIVLLLDASDTTFSSYRHVLEQARQTFAEIRGWFANAWNRPVWNFLCREWAKEDQQLAAFVAQYGLDQLRRHTWNAPAYDYIEPVKDATGDMLKLSNALTSPRRFSASRHSCDWQQLFEEIVVDWRSAIEFAMQQADEVNALGLEQISWRDLLPMPALKTTLSLTESPSGDITPTTGDQNT